MDYSHLFNSEEYLFHPPPVSVPTTTTSTITTTTRWTMTPTPPPPPQPDYPYIPNFMFPPPVQNQMPTYPIMPPLPQPVGHPWGGGGGGGTEMYTNMLMGGTTAAGGGDTAITSGLGEQVFPLTLDQSACVRDLRQRRPEKEPIIGSGSVEKKGTKRRNSEGGGRERRQATNTSSLGNADDGGPSYGGRRTTSSRFLTHIPSTLLTVDGVKLRFVLQKELRNSDVGNFSRIVLPKRDCEAFLPFLAIKEGMQINLKDVFSSYIWKMRYRYWPNNNSRMYVLENTSEKGYCICMCIDCKCKIDAYASFIRKNELTTGDYIALYEDNDKQLFICAIKAANRPPDFVPGAPTMNEANEQPKMVVAAPPQQLLIEQCYDPYPTVHAPALISEEAGSSNDPLKQTDNPNDPAAILDFGEYDFSVLDNFTYFDDPDIPPYDFNQH